MSGAQLQTAGQIRNGFPYMAGFGLTGTIQVVNAVIVSKASSKLVWIKDVPFDSGPDRGGRVFVAINSFSIIITGNPLTGGDFLAGDLYYRGVGGNRLHLLSVVHNLQYMGTYRRDGIIVSSDPLFADKVNDVGIIEWEDNASLITTSDAIILNYRLNIGFYSDYKEFDMERLHEELHNIPRARPQVDLERV